MEPFCLAALCRQVQNRVEMDHFRSERQLALCVHGIDGPSGVMKGNASSEEQAVFRHPGFYHFWIAETVSGLGTSIQPSLFRSW